MKKETDLSREELLDRLKSFRTTYKMFYTWLQAQKDVGDEIPTECADKVLDKLADFGWA